MGQVEWILQGKVGPDKAEELDQVKQSWLELGGWSKVGLGWVGFLNQYSCWWQYSNPQLFKPILAWICSKLSSVVLYTGPIVIKPANFEIKVLKAEKSWISSGSYVDAPVCHFKTSTLQIDTKLRYFWCYVKQFCC